MKTYQLELLSSLDNKIDIRSVKVMTDKFTQENDWITITIQLASEQWRTFKIPREQIKRIEISEE